MVIVALLIGCADGSIDLGVAQKDTAAPPDDAGTGGGPEDSGGGDDPGGDSGTSDETGNTSPPPQADTSAFTGSERFTYDVWGWTCDETRATVGTLVPEGTGNWGALAAACAGCSSFYQVEFDADYACDWIALPTVWYGFSARADSADTHLILDFGDGGLYDVAADATGSFDGFTATHTWDLEIYYVPVRVEGSFTFPLRE